MSKDDFKYLQEMTIEFIAKSRRLVSDSSEEELYAINLDLFKI